MENDIKELSAKIDKVLENQELILKQLAQSTIITNETIINPVKLNKKELERKKIDDIKLLIGQRRLLQSKFNLVTAPHPSRILAYLKTNDERVFDGLKRNS